MKATLTMDMPKNCTECRLVSCEACWIEASEKAVADSCL